VATALFALLILSLPVLMIASQIYVMRQQDNLSRYLIVLVDDSDVDQVIGLHVEKHKLKHAQKWSSPVKGYTAIVPVRSLRSLSEDPYVVRIQAREEDELSARWHPESS
jgi:hypothetical protein